MEIAVGLDQGLQLGFREQRDLVREAARLGYASAWTPAALSRDPFQICAQWTTMTNDIVLGGIKTGISVVPAAMWSVPVLAATSATVGDLTGGRFVLGIGAGSAFNEMAQRNLGLPTYQPIKLMRDYLVTLHQLLIGERVEYEGEIVKLHGVQLGFRPPHVPIYLAALGPQMLRLGGELADGIALNWCMPEQILWSRARIAEGALRVGRIPDEVRVIEYIRMCVDEDEDIARRAFTKAVLGYAMASPGFNKNLGYRAHFARMGFDEALMELEARRERGATETELIDNFPRELLLRIGYFGSALGAAPAFRRLAVGLDVAIARVVPARPGLESILAVIQACRPELALRDT